MEVPELRRGHHARLYNASLIVPSTRGSNGCVGVGVCARPQPDVVPHKVSEQDLFRKWHQKMSSLRAPTKLCVHVSDRSTSGSNHI